MKKIIFLVFLCAFLTVNAQKKNPEITVDELKEMVGYLADDKLEGRLPGSGNDIKAAEYLIMNIRGTNVKLLGENGLQYFDVITGTDFGKNNALSINGKNLGFGKDFTTMQLSSSGTVKGSIVFAGYGFNINTPELKWNDYDGLDVKGKIVMILRGAPKDESMKATYDTYSPLRKKIITARDAGAAAVIFVNGEDFDAADNLAELNKSGREPDAGIPAVQIKRNIAGEILKKAVTSYEKEFAASKKPASFNTGSEAEITASIEIIKKRTANVIAVVEGTDPVLKNEYVLVGAHYDHLGYGGMGSGSRRPDTVAIHNGADDNASGSAAIAEIIEKIAEKPFKRSVIYMAFGAEEMGLLGSKYFTDNPVQELNKIKFMINLDMVGRLGEDKVFTIGGIGTSPDLKSIVETLVPKYGFKPTLSQEGYGPSDHASFYAKNIPVMFLFTGVHEDYHTPADDADKINYEGQKEIADFAYDVLNDVANRDNFLQFTEAGPKERPQSSGYKVSLGIMPDMSSSDIKGVRAEAVIPGKPAEKGGMKKGDIIVALNGKPVTNLYEYMDRLNELKKGDVVKVDVQRDGATITLEITL
ncbi:MAG: M28 family peptidase [Ignavibacteriaceae bacterium]|nr:M28 family peptidase [Ignavibacteriaceae bacterium]